MGMDITLGYFHKLLAELIPPCEQTSIRWGIAHGGDGGDGGGSGGDGDGGDGDDDDYDDGDGDRVGVVVVVVSYFHNLLPEIIPPCEQTSVRWVMAHNDDGDCGGDGGEWWWWWWW